MLDLFGGSIFSFDFSASESDWLPESEPLPESLLPDWLLLLEELELEPEPEPDAEPDPEPDSSSELLNGWRKDRVRERERGCHTRSFVIWPKVFSEVISLKRNILHTEHLLQSVKARNAKEEAKITALTCGRWLKISHLWYKLKIEAYEENVEDDKTVVYDVNCRLRITVLKYRCV